MDVSADWYRQDRTRSSFRTSFGQGQAVPAAAHSTATSNAGTPSRVTHRRVPSPVHHRTVSYPNSTADRAPCPCADASPRPRASPTPRFRTHLHSAISTIPHIFHLSPLNFNVCQPANNFELPCLLSATTSDIHPPIPLSTPTASTLDPAPSIDSPIYSSWSPHSP